MKRLLTYLATVLIAVACSNDKENTFTINGTIGEGDTRLYLFGLDRRNEVLHTIECNPDGEFSFSMTTDTVTPMLLLLPDGKSITIYGEPGTNASLAEDKSTKNGWRVDGGTIQELHDSISRILDRHRRKEDMLGAIDSFITAHPINEVSIEIIRRYLVDVPNPNNAEIRSRISKLGGMMQDHEFIASIKKNTEQKHSNVQNRSLPAFEYETADNKKVTASTYLKKYLLVTYWSTWEEACLAEMKKLRKIEERLDSNYFAVLNISFDHDTAAWRKRLETDTIAGDNVCDRAAWNSVHVEKINIPELPYSILVNPYSRILRYGVEFDKAEEQIFKPVEKFIKEDKEKKEKERKKKTNK